MGGIAGAGAMVGVAVAGDYLKREHNKMETRDTNRSKGTTDERVVHALKAVSSLMGWFCGGGGGGSTGLDKRSRRCFSSCCGLSCERDEDEVSPMKMKGKRPKKANHHGGDRESMRSKRKKLSFMGKQKVGAWAGSRPGATSSIPTANDQKKN